MTEERQNTHSAARDRPKLILISGGVRSGKSAFALQRALELGERRALIATAQAFDDEMRSRIARHRAERGDSFDTIEEPLELDDALGRAASHDVVVIDCLTLWLSNRLLADDRSEAALVSAAEQLVARVRAGRAHCLLVSNEVGMGIVPESGLGRLFRDLAGTLHQAVARHADELYLATMGTVLRLRPGPLSLVSP